MSKFILERKIDEIEGMIETGWDFFAGPYTDEDVLSKTGKIKINDEEVQITNHMMESVIELIAAAKKAIASSEKEVNELKMDIRDLRRKLEEAENYASMSDPRIAGELDKQITWFEVNEGQEDLVYGPVKLMKYCRDRLRSRR